MVTQTQSDLVVSTYGGRTDIVSLAQRIKIMVPGGNKLNDAEAQALAQVSIVTQCNPFIGEIWYIPGRGPMIGIKGARRHGNEQIEQAGGKDAYWAPELIACTPEEAGAKDVKDVVGCYKCVITDSVSTGLFQRMFIDTVNSLRAAGSKDPVGEAREIVGRRPQWVGYGFSTASEQSRMNKQALARKRAEADALKQKFDIPFGAEVAAGDTAIEAETSDWVPADALKMVESAMSYDDAKQVIVKGKNGEKFLGQLSAEQLQYVIEHDKDNAEAAKVVLEHDFNMTDE